MKTTFALAISMISGAALAGDSIWINEFAPNPDGADPSMVDFEVRGTAGSMFTGSVYSIEGDFGAPNSVDRVSAITGMFDSNGILNVQIADLENPSFTVVLASGGSATTSDAIDGSSDISALFGTVYDAITVNDSASDEGFSVVPLLGVGTNFAYTGAEPERMFREATTGDWIAVNDVVAGTGIFGADGTEYAIADFVSDPSVYNFGDVNQSFIPAPGAVALASLGGLVATRRRRA